MYINEEPWKLIFKKEISLSYILPECTRNIFVLCHSGDRYRCIYSFCAHGVYNNFMINKYFAFVIANLSTLGRYQAHLQLAHPSHTKKI